METPVLYSYALNGPRAGQALTGDDVAFQLEATALAWAHLDAKHPDTRAWILAKLPYLDRHVIDALLAEETRPRATEVGDGLLVILRGVNLNEGAEPEDMVSLRMWIDAHRIVSMRLRPLRAVQDIETAINAGEVPDDAGTFLAMVIERLTARMEPVLRDMDDSLDDIEEAVVEHPDPALRPAINDQRRRTIVLRRYIAPQRDAVAAIRLSRVNWLDDSDRHRLAEAHDRLTRIVEDLDAQRERGQIVKDELATGLADRLNRNTYILSVIAAIFLPLGFLTGLLGINIGGIPGADHPQAFWIFLGMLAVLVGLQVWLFRKLRWF